MKASLIMATFVVAVGVLSACADTGTGVNDSTLGMESRQTGRIPSPRNIGATNTMNASRMIAPTAQ